MIPVRVIERKRDGEEIDPGSLESFLRAFLDGGVPDYQMSAFLMAAFFRGLSEVETEVFVCTMVDSGSSLDLSYLPAPRVDKHSTGGVGDKVSLALAPLAAALGLYVPMMSGRGLGHTTGTLDKLEAIPGFRTNLELDDFERVLRRVGCAMIGQTREIAPLDRLLYALRDVTGTVPVLPLIAASIMSKKLAEGLNGLVLDVKVGAGAFLPEEDRALTLAQTMVDIGAARGLPTVALLTAMDRPLGAAIGNGLETREAIDCLRSEGPDDLRALVVRQAAEMLLIAGEAEDLDVAKGRAVEALDSGAALERLASLVEAQGGDPRVVERPELVAAASDVAVVPAPTRGIVESIDPRALGHGVITLGGGRTHMKDDVDLGVGFVLDVQIGSDVQEGQPLGTVHARSEDGASRGADILCGAVRIGQDGPVVQRPLISHRVTAGGIVLD